MTPEELLLIKTREEKIYILTYGTYCASSQREKNRVKNNVKKSYSFDLRNQIIFDSQCDVATR